MTTFGWFGGTFDPPHSGHLLAAAYAVAIGGLQRLFVVPTRHHPFGKQPIAGWQERCHMCELTMRALRDVEVIDADAGDGPSYAIDSLEQLMQRHPQASWRLVIGSDLLGELPRWHEQARLVQLAPPLVVPRTGYCDSTLAIPAISASALRHSLQHGEVPEGWLVRSVSDYIVQQRLYVDGAKSNG